MSKRALLSGYYGFENLGDDLILEVLVQHLKSWNIIPVVLSESPAMTRRLYNVEAIQRTELPKIWQEMKQADWFISGGGGLFQDTTGLGSPIYYGGLIELAHYHKLPVAFFAQGVGPLHSGIGKAMLKRVIQHCSLITVRDAKSQAFLQQLAKSKVHPMADSVWTWQPDADIKALPKVRPGISLRPWVDLQDDEIVFLANMLGQLQEIQANGLNLLDCQAGSDILPLSKLEAALKKQGIQCHWFSQSTCIQGIAQSSRIIAMRYHALLVAAQLGIPAIAISYDPKVQFMAAQLKLTDFPITRLKTHTLDDFKYGFSDADEKALQNNLQSATNGFQKLKDWLGV